MTVVTRFSFKSGDREALDAVVEDIVETSRRKGAEMKGPHQDPPTDHEVTLYRRLDGDADGGSDNWTYTVFQRRIELRGYDELAREFLEKDYPASIQIEAEVK
ncbi:MAG: 30S ribosomal protein S10 [Halobacteriota archaeon]